VAAFALALVGTVWALGGQLVELRTAPAAGERPRPIERPVPTVTIRPAPTTTTARRPPSSTTGAPAEPTTPSGGRPGSLPLRAATGTVGGRTWELGATGDTVLSNGQANRCLHLDWPAAGAAEARSALRCEAAGRLTVGAMLTPVSRLAVVGAAPSAADRIRVELAGRPAVTVDTLALEGLSGRWYVAFVPAGAEVTGAVALEGRREVTRTSELAPTAPMVGLPPAPVPGDPAEVPPPPGAPPPVPPP
jgi:hypothetical protein